MKYYIYILKLIFLAIVNFLLFFFLIFMYLRYNIIVENSLVHDNLLLYLLQLNVTYLLPIILLITIIICIGYWLSSLKLSLIIMYWTFVAKLQYFIYVQFFKEKSNVLLFELQNGTLDSSKISLLNKILKEKYVSINLTCGDYNDIFNSIKDLNDVNQINLIIESKLHSICEKQMLFEELLNDINFAGHSVKSSLSSLDIIYGYITPVNCIVLGVVTLCLFTIWRYQVTLNDTNNTLNNLILNQKALSDKINNITNNQIQINSEMLNKLNLIENYFGEDSLILTMVSQIRELHEYSSNILIKLNRTRKEIGLDGGF